ncbi:MAG: oligoendopeptidase F [Haloferacaceae archaeon]|nr:oligoendopeptidase F [Haloferacaceae archaeon]
MDAVPTRDTIEPRYRWDLTRIYPDIDDWEAAVDAVGPLIEAVAAGAGEVDTSGARLLEILEAREQMGRHLEQIGSYAMLHAAEDTRDQTAQAMKARIAQIRTEAAAAASYLRPELIALSAATLEAFIDAEPALERYEHYLHAVRRLADHTRSREVESVLAGLGDVMGGTAEVFSLLTNADMRFPSVKDPDGDPLEITQGNFGRLQRDPDRPFRHRVYEAFYGEWDGVRNALGAALRTSVTEDVRMAETRGYDSALAAALDPEAIPTTVYTTLIETVEDRVDALHAHLELKAAALELDALRPWDLYVSIGPGEPPTMDYDTACAHIIEAVAPLGSSYQTAVATGLQDRWVDVYETRGKRSGAFSAGTYDTEPFILMNWQEDLSSMFTLAHELGHSMHSQLANAAQPWHDASYSIFTAEVASTVNETLLLRHLLATHEAPRFRLHLLNEFLERVRSTLFRQTLFASFEEQIHDVVETGEGLTPDRCDELYGELKQRYYAPAELDPQIRTEWMRIPHFYYNFYVYQYATGISAAMAIVDAIEAEGEPAAAAYREALSLGGSAFPVDVLATAGVDVTAPAFIETAIDVYADAVETAHAALQEL